MSIAYNVFSYSNASLNDVNFSEDFRISVTVDLPSPNSLANDAGFSPFEARVQILSLSSILSTIHLRFAILLTLVSITT